MIFARPESAWIGRDLEQKALAHAIADVVPEHLEEVATAKLAWIDKAGAAVKDRLTKEISYWDHRAEDLKPRSRPAKPTPASIPGSAPPRGRPAGAPPKAHGGARS